MNRHNENALAFTRGTNQNIKQFKYSAGPLSLLLDRLDNPRKYGQGYRVRCPAHEGKSSATLSIREADDGRVLLHCFSGCSALAIVHSLGLELADLFERPPAKANYTPAEKSKFREYARQAKWKAAFEFLPLEIRIAAIAAEDMARGRTLEPADVHRLKLAASRISNARRSLCHGR